MSTRRTIIHPTQLTNLPEGTILMDRCGLPVWRTDHAGWRSANGGRNIDLQLLIEDGAPFVILYQPAAEYMNPERPARTNADTSRISAEPSDAEVRAAARALIDFDGSNWDSLGPAGRKTYSNAARAALVAARKVTRHE